MLQIRDATEHDAEACSAIYRPYVTDSAISFELDPPATEQMAARIASAAAQHAWLVLDDAERVVGFAYGQAFRERAAYRFTCETSIYLESGRRRTGGGRALYQALLARLVERGYRRAVAGMTLPNEASVALHRALGFEPVGIYRGVGWKHGRWHDVAWMQKTITPDDRPVVEPR